jgi:outer membrane receptor protein involved in Fe transport
VDSVTNASDSGSDEILLDEITITATRMERNTFDIPQDVTVIGQNQIKRRIPKILPDLLEGAEGVFVQRTTPGQANPIIRGLVGSSLLTLVDGMRLNTAFFRPAPNQYMALVDAQNVDSIEVVRGSGSTLYGSDAIGGVINILTPIPRFDSEQWQTRSKVRGHFSSADSGYLSRLAVETGKKGIAFSTGFTYQAVDDVRGGGEIGVQRPSGFTSYAFDSKLVVEREAQEFLLNVQYLQQPKTPRYDELTPGFGQTTPSSATFFFQPNDRLFIHSRYRLSHPLPFLARAEFNLSFQEIHDDRRARDFASPTEIRERNKSRLLGATLQLTSALPGWLTLTYGGEAYLDTISSQSEGVDVSTGQQIAQTSRFPNGSTLNSFGVYVEGEVKLHPRLTAVVGGRFSYVEINIPKADREVGAHLNPSAPTGHVGLLYRLTPEVNLVTNISRGFRVPNVFDLSTLGSRPGNRFAIPNPNLKAEEAISFDAGTKVRSDRFTAELIGFYTVIPNRIEGELTGTTTAEGRQIIRSANLNRVQLIGVETGGRIYWRSALEVYGNLTYTYGWETFSGGRVLPADRIPPLYGQIGLLYRPRLDVWVEPFLRVSSPQDRLSNRDRSDSRINSDGTAGWTTASLRAGWNVREDLTLQGTVENILDQPYREHGSGISAPGRNFIVALEGRF